MMKVCTHPVTSITSIQQSGVQAVFAEQVSVPVIPDPLSRLICDRISHPFSTMHADVCHKISFWKTPALFKNSTQAESASAQEWKSTLARRHPVGCTRQDQQGTLHLVSSQKPDKYTGVPEGVGGALQVQLLVTCILVILYIHTYSEGSCLSGESGSTPTSASARERCSCARLYFCRCEQRF